jgi:hypothetical protein
MFRGHPAMICNDTFMTQRACMSFFVSDTDPHIATADDIPCSQVALISGGGSGHEPAHAGYAWVVCTRKPTHTPTLTHTCVVCIHTCAHNSQTSTRSYAHSLAPVAALLPMHRSLIRTRRMLTRLPVPVPSVVSGGITTAAVTLALASTHTQTQTHKHSQITHKHAHTRTCSFVGGGMLTAAVLGGVFASPSAASVFETIRAVAGPPGCLLIVKNYTGPAPDF